MCHSLPGKEKMMMSTHCGCDCMCPASLTIDDEIRMLENCKKAMKDQLDVIDRKIAALKTVKEP
jgi:hypothetical protein